MAVLMGLSFEGASRSTIPMRYICVGVGHTDALLAAGALF